ncbi:TRAP transporter small permease [Afifella pfennigii]|uniref:TRAP transporter small permease n=1 Tax=Afifella pfennigii TaxID=209897 RepID=UPI00055418F8|nr:TRAP transporter small permease [Afifella pfennigii]
MSYIVRILKPVIVLLFLAMTAVTFAATLARLFPFLPSVYWAGEVSRYLNFWITCLGIGVALHLGTHFSMTMVRDVLPPLQRRLATAICHIGVLILAGILIHYGIQMIQWNFDQLSAAMQLPMSYVYAAIPICGALMILETVPALVRVLLNREPEDEGGQLLP